MTTTYTASLRLNKPDFRTSGWSLLLNNNWDTIDTAISNILLDAGFVPWVNGAQSTLGMVAFDTSTNPLSYWICNVTHTNAGAGTFATERLNNPTYWTQFVFNYRPRGSWTHLTQYLVNDISYDSTLGITGICKTAHISNAAGTINDDAANWDFIVFLPGSLPATSIGYNNATSGMTATNAQAAIDEVEGRVDTLQTWRSGTADPELIDYGNRITALEASLTAANATITMTKAETGDFIITHRNVAKTGWLVIADQTIGDASSTATFADPSAQALFTLLYGLYNNTICPVSGGRGASAAADWAAHKKLTMTLALGRAIVVAGAAGSGLTARAAGVIGGEETHILTSPGETPAHSHANSLNEGSGHTHNIPGPVQGSGGGSPTSAFRQGDNTTGPTTLNFTSSLATTGMSITNASTGSGGGHNTMQPFVPHFVHVKL
jgi:hypothetical protein